MAIQFTVHQLSREDANAFDGLEDLGVSNLVLREEPRLVQNLEAAARLHAAPSHPSIFASHWAGDGDPVVAARQLAFLDRRLFGHFGLRIAEKPADTLGHEAAWRRTDEYLTLLKRLWSNEKPFDHECEFYSVRQGFVDGKGPQGALIPIRMTGLTGTALQVCARHATIFDMPFGSGSAVGATVAKLRESAGRFGRARAIRFALHIPDSEIGEKLQSPEGHRYLQRFLIPYKELGISEFVFSAAVAVGLGAARLGGLRLALDEGNVDAASTSVRRRFGRLPRLVN